MTSPPTNQPSAPPSSAQTCRESAVRVVEIGGCAVLLVASLHQVKA